MRRAQMLLCIEGVLYFSVHFRLFLPSGSSHLSTVKFYREQKETLVKSLRVEIIFFSHLTRPRCLFIVRWMQNEKWQSSEAKRWIWNRFFSRLSAVLFTLLSIAWVRALVLPECQCSQPSCRCISEISSLFSISFSISTVGCCDAAVSSIHYEQHKKR